MCERGVSVGWVGWEVDELNVIVWGSVAMKGKWVVKRTVVVQVEQSVVVMGLGKDRGAEI